MKPTFIALLAAGLFVGCSTPQLSREAVIGLALINADKGDAEAQTFIRLEYDDGKWLPENDEEAVKWFRKAAEQGYAEGQYFLGSMYDVGEGVPEDYVTAYAWYNIAAANGNASAKKTKPILASLMTADQITKAEELSKEMVKKNPKLLKK